MERLDWRRNRESALLQVHGDGVTGRDEITGCFGTPALDRVVCCVDAPGQSYAQGRAARPGDQDGLDIEVRVQVAGEVERVSADSEDDFSETLLYRFCAALADFDG